MLSEESMPKLSRYKVIQTKEELERIRGAKDCKVVLSVELVQNNKEEIKATLIRHNVEMVIVTNGLHYYNSYADPRIINTRIK